MEGGSSKWAGNDREMKMEAGGKAEGTGVRDSTMKQKQGNGERSRLIKYQLKKNNKVSS